MRSPNDITPDVSVGYYKRKRILSGIALLSTLPSASKLILIALILACDDTDSVAIYQRELGAFSSLSSRSVNRHINILHRTGFIAITPRWDGLERTANKYTLNIPILLQQQRPAQEQGMLYDDFERRFVVAPNA